MVSLRKDQILDPPSPYVTVIHFFQYTLSPCITRKILMLQPEWDFKLSWAPGDSADICSRALRTAMIHFG